MKRGAVLYAAMIGCVGAAVAAAIVMAGPSGRRPAPGGADANVATFVNWETGQIHPVDLTPDGTRLLVCNTADNRLEVFDLTGGAPVLVSEIPVGLDPIAVRARTNTEAWVVNSISDSVSVVSLTTRNVVNTLKTKDEPSDVVFAGSPQRAYVSCSQSNAVQVFDPANLGAAPVTVPIDAEHPRALGVSPDGSTVYAAIFESGNGSTLLGGGTAGTTLAFPPNVVSNAAGPYAGQNPPPNAGATFSPAQNGANPAPPAVGLIVKKDGAGQWMDDNAHNWTAMVSGAQAGLSGRPVGWDLPDRDVAVISTSNLAVSYATTLMNICMGLSVNPASGQVAVVGTDGTNEVRFEPNVRGRFVHVELALVNPVNLSKTIKDLNPHLLPYTVQQLPTQAARDRAIGDPRGIAWNSAGTRAFVTGMGSNNVVVVNAAGDRAGLAETIPVGQGPTGVAFDAGRNRVYVLNRFDATISVIDAATETVSGTVAFYDPTPTPIKVGRKHLYDTHKTSGLGQASCGSCHVDGKMDRLAWDLGDPSGTVKSLSGLNLGAGVPGLNTGFQPFHPMKGPMTTQTLQDIVGKEPFHWRGDRLGLEEFNPAFIGLLGDDVALTGTEMQEFEDFLATIAFPPNPYRNFDNTLPTNLDMTGFYSSGRFLSSGGLPAGAQLPTGHPNAGLALYRDSTRRLDNGTLACVTCHTLPTGAGTDSTFNLATTSYQPIAPGAQGQHHLALVSQDGSTNVSIKIPQLRNAYKKLGFDCSQVSNRAGFGFVHDGSVDTLFRFVTEPVFTTATDQEATDLVAFILCIGGSDLPAGSPTTLFEPPGVASKDVPASVGAQTTVLDGATAPASQTTLINQMISLAQANKVGLVVKGIVNGEQRGFVYRSATSLFQPDRASQASLSAASLLALAHAGSELTYTVVPKNTEVRAGIDRDEDGVLDRDQADVACYANCDGSHTPPILNVNDFACFLNRFAAADPWANCDGSTTAPVLNVLDFSCFLNKFAAGCQ